MIPVGVAAVANMKNDNGKKGLKYITANNTGRKEVELRWQVVEVIVITQQDEMNERTTLSTDGEGLTLS